MLDYYKLLNIDRTANSSDIKKAYRIAAMFWHPDKNKSTQAHQKFIDITEAYNILIDKDKRKIYDELLGVKIYDITNYSETRKKDFYNKRKTYEEWIKEEQTKAEKLSKISFDKILTDGFHFIDVYGWLILFIVMTIFLIIVLNFKK